MTSGYGESLGRWVMACALVLGGFSLLYGAFGLTAPVFPLVRLCLFQHRHFHQPRLWGHPPGVAGKMAASAEILAGLVMFGLLLTFISNRFERT